MPKHMFGHRVSARPANSSGKPPQAGGADEAPTGAKLIFATDHAGAEGRQAVSTPRVRQHPHAQRDRRQRDEGERPSRSTTCTPWCCPCATRSAGTTTCTSNPPATTSSPRRSAVSIEFSACEVGAGAVFAATSAGRGRRSARNSPAVTLPGSAISDAVMASAHLGFASSQRRLTAARGGVPSPPRRVNSQRRFPRA